MSTPPRIALAFVALFALGAATVIHAARFGAGPGGTPQIGHPLGHAFSDADRAKIKKAALAHVAASTKGQTVRVMGVSSLALREGKETEENLQKHVAQALVFNYATGKASRLTLDPATGKITGQEEVKGHIDSSPEERAEGAKIIQADAKVFKKGGNVVGGFIVPPPKGEPATKVPHRYLEFHVTAADHTHQSVVVVDLTAKKVVSSKGL
jgi:hypothetical protein